MEQFFPNGVGHYLIGGLILGSGIGLIYVLTGRVAGISSFFSGVHSFWSRAAFFNQSYLRDDRVWKTVLVVGLILGAAVYTVTLGDTFTTEVQWWRLLAGGVLVGFGTRMARGCTSGHGICGIGSLSPASIVATLIFMGTAIVTANIVLKMGVMP